MLYLLIITFILAPAYAIRFNLGFLPRNILMMWVFLVWIAFVVNLIAKKRARIFLTAVKNIREEILLTVGFFFISGIISLFIKGFDQAKLGQFIVLFLQPISIFFIGKFFFEQHPQSKSYLLLTTYYLLALAGLYAILQYFTLLGLPQIYWGNANEPKRALSFFAHPNFYALWSAPLLALLIPDVFENLKSKILNLKSLAWALGALGLLLSFSRAGFLGLAAAIGIYLIVAAEAKIRKLIFAAVIVMVIVIISVPNLRWRFVLPFYGEKSAISRLSLWHTGVKAIKESPIFGLGLTGFGNNWQKLNTDPNLDTHNFPHNVFLNFWVETGLLGLISFLGLISIYIYRGLRPSVIPAATEPRSGEGLAGIHNLDSRQPAGKAGFRGNDIKLAVALFLICLLFQGLIDNPYFKNDLAMVFWMVLSLSI